MSFLIGNIAYQGLNSEQVIASTKKWGSNQIEVEPKNEVIRVLLTVLQDPMIILLLVASMIYFYYGHQADGVLLTIAIILVAAISIFQNRRSRNAINQLRELSQPLCKVIRDNQLIQVNSESIVVGDIVLIDEESVIVADGEILNSNDLSINESILTGESLPVFKSNIDSDRKVYKGTIVSTGSAVIRITEIGLMTKLGQIGKSMDAIKVDKSPIQLQIETFVKRMIVIGIIVFIIVLLLNFLRTKIFVNGLLESLALAMSILPEEIPVAFATFTAMGAWRLARKGVIVKDMNTVETLGNTTVICVDKTGTVTQNKMELAGIYIAESDTLICDLKTEDENCLQLLSTAMWASEPIPVDPMEKALHEAYELYTPVDRRRNYQLFHEYPLAGHPPMMTHIYRDDQDHRIIAAKGALETILRVSDLNREQTDRIARANQELSQKGYRILGVAMSTEPYDVFPIDQEDISFQFLGLVAFYDPPKSNISEVFSNFYKAGIKVKMITGDTVATASHLAKEVEFEGYDSCISGEDLMKFDGEYFDAAVRDNNLFCRMFPDAKLRVVESLKCQNNIVSMVGDGVNDGPALKAANIGIAMGKKGTEIAKQAASIVLTDDNLSSLVYAVSMGRKIYANLKKAIRYIISIHIPIILIVFIPLALGWVYPHVFTPVHIIFLELVMGPTCSIIYENEPLESNLMSQKPQSPKDGLFSWQELLVSIFQGLVITLGLILLYQYSVLSKFTEVETRSMIFLSLITANIALTFVNRSFSESLLRTIAYRNRLVTYITLITITLTVVIFSTQMGRDLFHLSVLGITEIAICIGVGALSVLWFEVVKILKNAGRSTIQSNSPLLSN